MTVTPTSPHEQALAAATAAIQEIHFDSHGLTREIAESAISAYLAALPAPDLAGKHERYMRAYFHEFTPTGVDAVDAVLEAIALAGKGYHYTGDWTDADQYGPDGYWSLIQLVANNAAGAFRSLSAKLAAVERERDTLTARLAEMETGR